MNQPIDTKNLTPAMRQFYHFKKQYPDAILFFRMGDFYETFYDDAKTCSRVLGITLTSRGKDADQPIPLAGVPYHAVDRYLNNMIKAGYKVAVCEQVEDPKQAQGVVKRDVVRLVTPGTLTEDSLLDERTGNFLAAICFDRAISRKSKAAPDLEPVGLAWVELSTGQFFTQKLQARHLLDELVRLHPAECIISDDPDSLPAQFLQQLSQLTTAPPTRRPAWVFDKHTAQQNLTTHFATKSLEGFGFTQTDCSVVAAGAIIEYLNETQKTTLNHIAQLRQVSRENFLQIDQTTLRSLEIERTIRDNAAAGSLLNSIDKTLTAMGARMLRQWLCYPLNNLASIQARQDAVAELIQFDPIRDQLRSHLSEIADIERIATRISTGRANPRDLLGLGRALRQLPTLRQLIQDNCSTAMLVQLAQQCDTLDDIADLIEAAIDPEAPLAYREGGVIRTGFDEQVDQYRSICTDGKTWLAEYQTRLSRQIDFPNLKVGYNKVFGYYVEITNAFRGQLPPDFIRKQTLKNAERYITEELKKYEDQALNADQRCKQREQELFQQIRLRIASQTLLLQQVADAVAQIDVLAAFAQIARRRNYTRPIISDQRAIRIVEGRHPVLDVTLENQFVPNDITLDSKSANIAIITGPNMSGKSTYIRQTALLVLLAQTGSFIPAQKAEIGLTDRIFTRVGASDELTRGQSTFMVEMTETANIVNNATDRSLVILDEIGRGTSTYDGLALAWAITEHIATKINCPTLFATHYHEITELADLLPNVTNLNVAVREWKNEVVFMHKIVQGRTDKSYGIHVAKLAGIPKAVIKRSQEILDELEANFQHESQAPQLGGRLKPLADQEPTLFDDIPADPILDKLHQLDLDNLTPIQAINLLHEIKNELENR
ncbi:MAG: DNA mismatch repair protein MutS [Sedimentisphaerales bacterium]|nr:DNA mismatch repair protein MutS [Sedimentisphaerales bacterium]